MKIKNTNDLENHLIKCVIYGESGAGKTMLASTLKGPTLIVSAEKGLLSIAGSDISYIDIGEDDDGKQIERPLERLLRLKSVLDMLQSEKKTFENIFIDSLTEISQILVQALGEQFPDAKDTIRLWGENAKRMRLIVKGFRDLPYHVFMTCVAQPDKDDNNKRYMNFMLGGKVPASELPQYFDEVFYLHSGADGKRTLMTKKTEALLCKDRSNKLDMIEEPNLELIKGKILR